ncbi:MAG: SNF2 family DNA or RNA helicase [Myxococcota bacterium]
MLHELPPRTDITVRVDLSRGEAALYEALRAEALADLEAADGASTWRMKVFAHLTRLRLAVCNPRLVEGAPTLDSAKLAAFAGLVEDLRAGGHRALVFSQFVRHLDLVREWLDDQGVSYQYLDGKTSTAGRERAVAAFQAGEGDLFLISLRAGGTGLNLTAADYVLHLDPWWNPAVEDQASDRAHRIGQTRPVTVYRLVAANTIEEAIVDLHAKKRALADSILDGAEAASALTVDDMRALLAGTRPGSG